MLLTTHAGLLSSVPSGDANMRVRGQVGSPLGDLSGHVIICGAEDSFVNFVAQLVRTIC